MSDTLYLSKITLPGGSTYDLKDAKAWQDIADLKTVTSSAMHYAGVTTTTLSDGSTTSTITIDGESKTFGAGDAGAVVISGEMEYVWNGSKWQEFGSTGSLKALAFKDSASATYTPAGSVSQPTFTGTAATIDIDVTATGDVAIQTGSGTANYTPAGTVSQPTFSGDEGNVSVKGTAEGDVTISVGSGAENYTPDGTVSQPTFSGNEGNVSVSGTSAGSVAISVGNGTANYTPAGTVTVTPSVQLNTTTVSAITGVGTLPTCTLPVMTTTVANETLTLGWTAGSFDQGTLPTKDDNVTVATGIKSQTATGSFVGTGAELKATFTGDAVTSTGKFTPSGSVSQPTFSGTAVALEASFNGSEVTSTGKFTPAGSISQPTFSGTGVDLEATFTGTKVTSSASYTPTGTVSKPDFTGTESTITVS